jgi:hypothetical protein
MVSRVLRAKITLPVAPIVNLDYFRCFYGVHVQPRETAGGKDGFIEHITFSYVMK